MTSEWNRVSRVIAGCDGGGTSTFVQVCLLDADGQIVREGWGQDGPSNVLADREALERIRGALRMALQSAGTDDSQPIDGIVLGLAGAGAVCDQQRIARFVVEEKLARQATVVPDADIILAAADLAAPNIALIAGTGSIAWGQRLDGVRVRAGGRGPLLGDEGSGYWIGLTALQQVVRQLDKRTVTTLSTEPLTTEPSRVASPLAEQILTACEATDLSQLVQHVYSDSYDRRRIASLAPIVFECAATDPVARKIVDDTAKHLTRLVLSIAIQLESTEPMGLAVAGSVLVSQPALVADVMQRSRKLGIELLEPVVVDSPVAGAVRLARQLSFE